MLSELDLEQIGDGRPVRDRAMAECCRSGLWLLHNHLDRSHTISQDIDTPTGSYWHGIMHRREPDYSNAKYWFRRVGDHPIFEALAEQVHQQQPLVAESCVSHAQWDPFAFVDACQHATRDADLEQACREVAQLEWLNLFAYCYQHGFDEAAA